MEGLTSMGYVKPTPIQEQTIPILLEGHDLIACAQTGTGKTASYLLPVIQKMSRLEERHLNTLILSPTRELAQQIDQQVEGLAYFTGISSIAVYGGGDGLIYEQQRKAIIEGADIMIATPGRLISFLVSGVVKFDHLEHLVLDEADRMLDMGFYDDILKIMSYLPGSRQTMLFSATMPPRIRELAKRILKNPEQVNISLSKPAEGIDQRAYLVYDEQKNMLLQSILAQGSYPSALIFASTKEKVKVLSQWFKKMNMDAEAFSSDLEQDERERILRAFKARQLPVIIGTDVLSRGIDVEGISLVLNYDVPPDPEDYIHRVGRTARAETKGTAITFVNEKDQRKFHSIEQLIGKEVLKIPLPEELGSGPEFGPRNGHRHIDISRIKKITKPYKKINKVENPENQVSTSDSSELESTAVNEISNLHSLSGHATDLQSAETPVEHETSITGEAIETSANLDLQKSVKKGKSSRKGKSSARSRPPHKAGDPRPEPVAATGNTANQKSLKDIKQSITSPTSPTSPTIPTTPVTGAVSRNRNPQERSQGKNGTPTSQGSKQAGRTNGAHKNEPVGRQHSGSGVSANKQGNSPKDIERGKQKKASAWDWLLFWKKK